MPAISIVPSRDSSFQRSFAALGLPRMKVGANHTLVVCEDGVLLLEADGRLTIFRKGKVVEDEPLPEITRHNHWKDWADNCLGAKKHLWTPLTIGWRITEPALRPIRAPASRGGGIIAPLPLATAHDLPSSPDSGSSRSSPVRSSF